MVAATHSFSRPSEPFASWTRRLPKIPNTRQCILGRTTLRACRRDCLERLRQSALADTTRFLNRALGWR